MNDSGSNFLFSILLPFPSWVYLIKFAQFELGTNWLFRQPTDSPSMNYLVPTSTPGTPKTCPSPL